MRVPVVVAALAAVALALVAAAATWIVAGRSDDGAPRAAATAAPSPSPSPAADADPAVDRVAGGLTEVAATVAGRRATANFLVVTTAELAVAAAGVAPGPLLVDVPPDQLAGLVDELRVRQVVAVGDVDLPADLGDTEVRTVAADDAWDLVEGGGARTVWLAEAQDALPAAVEAAVRFGGVPMLATTAEARATVDGEVAARRGVTVQRLEAGDPASWYARVPDPSTSLTVVPAGRPDLLAIGAQLDGRVVELGDDVDRHAGTRWLADTREPVTHLLVLGAVDDAALAQLLYRLGLRPLPDLALEPVVEGYGIRPECSPGPERASPCLSGERSQRVATSLRQPPGDARRFVVERAGLVRILRPNGTLDDRPFLDLSGQVGLELEQGLFDVAFPPDFDRTGRFSVSYTRASDGALVVAVHEVDPSDPDRARPDGTEVLVVPQPGAAHNGGALRFAPDGALWVGVGEGGDPQGVLGGQDPDTRLGTVLRLDVGDGTVEVVAYGLRNPFRLDLDPLTGIAYVADVGERAVEEVDVVRLGERGVNFGWPVFEGTACFDGASGRCGTLDARPPALTYPHTDGHCAIIGGAVYRGDRLPELRGSYLYGDFCAGDVRAVRVRADGSLHAVDLPGLDELPALLYAFGVDAHGELYLLTETAIHGLVRG